MAELLSKEKQFLKLNEQLNKMAITTTTNGGVAGPEGAKPEGRFLTFQKSKGPSTLLKKQGAGDGITDIVDLSNNITAGGETYRSSKRHNNETSPTEDSGTTPQYRLKSYRCNETSRSQTYNRASQSRVLPPNGNSTFTVKYRNPKFLESPSLEVLVKEESSTLRCQKDASRIGSLNSVAIEDGISTGRRSQTSNHTVASKKNISSEGLIKFLKSKIVILEEDHDRISHEMAKQKNLLDKALDHTKTIEQQRDQANAKNVSLTEQLAKTEKQLEETNRRLKERSLEQSAQHRELETAKRELKLLTQTNSNLEKRLFRANEELENTRKTLGIMKNAEREQKEAMRTETETKDKQIKGLKKQRADLLNAYKKQLFLIDNLKRQNICLEQAKMLDFSEKEFCKILDWNVKK
ncbi:hypothetical protein FF38_06067 [Lucilia cuprina]|uniref:Testis-expressed sequence 9 protein n=1 Tax=Lucilia cuprina TaxID=7375 RepID=A0A0L0CLX6_LUCCU|nr:Testis-expressed protein 9 [Lucilia cuprina]KNC33300.1 hypothetical protein FF38_06067 [Lucilia cuprina]